MSITVSFTTSSKRENSTKQLIMTATHDCNFKNGCSMLNPTLLLELNTNTFPAYTAFKIEDRYYNITDIRSVRNNLFEITGEVDVLATYKSNILSTTAYVLYDSIANTELVDSRLPLKTSKSVSVSRSTCPLVPSNGVYILSLTGANGSTGVYKVTIEELNDLIEDISRIYDNMFDYEAQHPAPTPPSGSHDVSDWVEYWTEWAQWLWESLKYPIVQLFGSGNIPENIRECKYIPFDVGSAQHSVNPVYLGTFETLQTLYQLTNDAEVHPATVSIPWQTNDWRRRSPYTDVYLYLPYIGMTKLSSENLTGVSTLNITYDICPRNGDLVCTVKGGDQVIGQYGANVAVEVPVGFSNISLKKAAQSIIQGAAAAVAKAPAALGLASLTFADSITPNFTCIGGLDGIAGIATDQNITCYTVFHDTIVPPNTELQIIGSPTMSPKSLANLTGFVQTMSASVDGAMTADERTKINDMLDRGIFIE